MIKFVCKLYTTKEYNRLFNTNSTLSLINPNIFGLTVPLSMTINMSYTVQHEANVRI